MTAILPAMLPTRTVAAMKGGCSRGPASRFKISSPPGLPGLWVLNAAASFVDARSGHPGGQRAGIGRTQRAFKRSSQPGFGRLAPVSDVRGRRCASFHIPLWRVVRLRWVGTSTAGHDVSGAGWQTFGRTVRTTPLLRRVGYVRAYRS